ncbi:MAG: YhbY family RNA-binding protein [Oscillospiraceae bacterium]|nr:YhbY family RNA-binding protein [Oscillospiraceae bacterium]
MLTSKDRATLRKAANGLDTIYDIGKDGIDDAVVKGVGEALLARELIKLGCQESCPLTAAQAAAQLAQALGAESVQVIGRRVVLYKRNKKIDKYGL